MVATVYKGNKCEIPGGMPIGMFMLKVREYHHDPLTAQLPFFQPVMEYLDPRRLLVVRAKARVWLEVTGRYPGVDDVNKFWEVRIARREGQVPLRTDAALAYIGCTDRDHWDDQEKCECQNKNILTCGECGSRYSPHHDGTHDIERCNLCGVVVIWREP